MFMGKTVRDQNEACMRFCFFSLILNSSSRKSVIGREQIGTDKFHTDCYYCMAGQKKTYFSILHNTNYKLARDFSRFQDKWTFCLPLSFGTFSSFCALFGNETTNNVYFKTVVANLWSNERHLFTKL